MPFFTIETATVFSLLQILLWVVVIRKIRKCIYFEDFNFSNFNNFNNFLNLFLVYAYWFLSFFVVIFERGGGVGMCKINDPLPEFHRSPEKAGKFLL